MSEKATIINKSRKQLMRLQDQRLTKHLNPRVISIHEPDCTNEGRYRVLRINGVRTKSRGSQSTKVTNLAFLDPTFLAEAWNFVLPDTFQRARNDNYVINSETKDKDGT